MRSRGYEFQSQIETLKTNVTSIFLENMRQNFS